MKSYLNNQKIPRGLRNNNPGNLVRTTIAWQGKVPHASNTDARFEQFSFLAWGVRAMILDMTSDIVGKKMNTIRKLITSYAPTFENPTANYIAAVAKKSGIAADAVLSTDKATMKRLVLAMVRVENGDAAATLFTEQDFEDGYALLPTAKKKF